MNKDEINFNLNKSTLVKAGGIGASFFPVLASMPFLVAHPNLQNFISILLPLIFATFFYDKLKEQSAKNREIIKKYKIKDYKTVIPDSIVSGLIGGGTLTFLLSSLQNPTKVNLFSLVWSSVFLIPEIIRLKKIIEHNKQQITKVR